MNINQLEWFCLARESLTQRFMTTSLYALGVRPYTHASITSVADGFATVHGKAQRPLRK